jgi:hypothetical protein
MAIIRPIIIGVCVAVFLHVVGLTVMDWQWWAGCISLNTAFNI